MEILIVIGVGTAAAAPQSSVDIELIAGGVAVVGGVASAVLWVSTQLSDIKEKLGIVKTSVEVYAERVGVLTTKVMTMEGKIDLVEGESDRRLQVLEEEVMLLFNYLVSLYKISGETKSHIEDLQSFLENCIVSYVVESSSTTVNRTYKRNRDKCSEDIVEEIRQLVASFTYAKASNNNRKDFS